MDNKYDGTQRSDRLLDTPFLNGDKNSNFLNNLFHPPPTIRPQCTENTFLLDSNNISNLTTYVQHQWSAYVCRQSRHHSLVQYYVLINIFICGQLPHSSEREGYWQCCHCPCNANLKNCRRVFCTILRMR